MGNVEFKQIGDVLNFCHLVEVENQENFRQVLDLLKEFNVIYKQEEENLPYHINLIEELLPHVSENAHSRILAKLLRYKNDKKYPFLESFLKDVCGFDNLDVVKPDIRKVDSCGHIDIPIFDKEYAVIIENKVNGAPEQNREDGGQIARYIEHVCKRYGFDEKKFMSFICPHIQISLQLNVGKIKRGTRIKNNFNVDFVP